jgi:hypothetical protein
MKESNNNASGQPAVIRNNFDYEFTTETHGTPQ